MARAYASKWMSGEEALEYLLQIETDLQKRITLLQTVVCDGAVRGRRRGIDHVRRGWRVQNGLDGNPDDSGKTKNGGGAVSTSHRHQKMRINL
jgi:hypothetical protein